MAGFVVENVFLEDLEIEEPSKNQTCTDINLVKYTIVTISIGSDIVNRCC